MRTEGSRDRSKYFESRRFFSSFWFLVWYRDRYRFSPSRHGQSMNAHYSAVLLRDDRNAMPDAMEADAAEGGKVRPRTQTTGFHRARVVRRERIPETTRTPIFATTDD